MVDNNNNNNKNNNNKNKNRNKNKRNNYNKNRNRNRNNKTNKTNKKLLVGQLTPLEQVFHKYDLLMDEYLKARFIYFERFYRAGGKNKEKIKLRHMNALKDLQNFASKLTDYQKENLDKRLNFFKKDLDYSTALGIDTEGHIEIKPEDIIDPHINLVQKQRTSYKDDTEESLGSIEDYNKYKNI